MIQDDMFVITDAFQRERREHPEQDLSDSLQTALENVGVSITFTSLTGECGLQKAITP